jgi:hypothetical protein
MNTKYLTQETPHDAIFSSVFWSSKLVAFFKPQKTKSNKNYWTNSSWVKRDCCSENRNPNNIEIQTKHEKILWRFPFTWFDLDLTTKPRKWCHKNLLDESEMEKKRKLHKFFLLHLVIFCCSFNHRNINKLTIKKNQGYQIWIPKAPTIKFSPE